MKSLRQLLEGIACTWNGKGELGKPITRVQSDSRRINPGDLFVAVPGSKFDGHAFIGEAILRGAGAIVAERFDRNARDLEIPELIVSDSRSVLCRLIASIYDFPARKLKLIGVTGTNGKTTTAFLIQHLLKTRSQAGLIGSIYYDDGRTKRRAEHTTPVPETLMECLAQMAAEGLSYCVMEVSSHALDQGRTRGLEFSSAVFTNLTQDHFDYHRDYEAYYQAKRGLFLGSDTPKRSLINVDDAYGRRLRGEMEQGGAVTTYGLREPCDYSAERIELDWHQIGFELMRKKDRWPVRAPLMLRHNVYNVLAALSTVSEEGFDLGELIPSLSHFPGVPGRMERIDEGQDFGVFVDYAHTPDGIANVLSSLSALSKRRVITVFGCGGDRDRTKRPVMGEASGRLSDVVILTSDNPRNEGAEDILDEIERGIDVKTSNVTLIREPDRCQAIRRAVDLAEPGDVVLILGKGHEAYQMIGADKIPFKDQEVARHWLKLRCSPLARSQKLQAGH